MRPLILAPALRAELLAFLGEHRFAAQASVSRMGAPQAAVVGIATSDELDIVFDTLADSRKAMNLRRDPRIALVVGGPDGGARTLQVDGVADEPAGADRERLVDAYLRCFPDGRERQA